MTDWTPAVAVINPERSLLLELLKKYKKYKVESMAFTGAMSEFINHEPHVVNALLERKQELKPSTEKIVDASFRRLETAIIDGSPYLSLLQEHLDRHE